ncbi:MAG: DNA polymerase III subunit delta [Ignavibacteria bacterium]|nr:DNA polymerase III subunit delta [Ignavibacteria bacterium]
MAKGKAPSISHISTNLKKGKFSPIYYFFGEDSFSLDIALKSVEEAIYPLISSDFDKETFYGESRSLENVLNLASAFPFGSEKKLLVFKQFEKVKNKKPLKDYAHSTADFTVLVIIHYGIITNLSSEPYKTLLENNFIFEVKQLKGSALVDWLVTYAESRGKSLVEKNAQVLVDMVGENRSMLEAQLEKILLYLKDENEITIESIQKAASLLKQFTIFDLQDAIAETDNPRTLEISYNLLDNGFEPVYVVSMLTRYFTGLSKVTELKSKNIPDQVAARIVGTHPFYYKGYVKARTIFSDEKLIEVFRSLLKADISIKTTNLDDKTLITILISEIL